MRGAAGHCLPQGIITLYVRLKTVKYIPVAGKIKKFNAGDWVEIGRQTAQQWLAAGAADFPGLDTAEAIAGKLDNTGVVAIGGSTQVTKSLRKRYPKLGVEHRDSPIVAWPRTLLWWPAKVKLLPDQVLVGFSRVEKTRPEYAAWEMAAMLFGPEASTFGNSEEKHKTRELIGDLRVPIYNPFALWIRKSTVTDKVVSDWWKQVENGANRFHALLRAIYVNRPLVCTLPVGWVGIR